MTAHREWLRVCLLCLLTTTTYPGSPAQAQTYPAGPVKFITPLGAGSGTDPAMRIVIDQLGKVWGQQTVLINQPGAGGALAARAAHSAAPDGHTLYMAIASTFTVLPQLQPDLPFNVNDFVPIGFVGEVPMAIAVAPALAVNSLPELIVYSKKQASGLNLAITRGSIPHMAAQLLRNRSGVDLAYVFYPGSSQAMSDVISGRVPIILDGIAGPITSGQLKLLAIAAPERVASHPDIPTVAETVPGFVATGWFVLVAPPGTPAAIVRKVSEDLNAVLARVEVRQKLDALSISTRTMSPERLSEFIESEHQLWKPVIQQLGLATQ